MESSYTKVVKENNEVDYTNLLEGGFMPVKEDWC